MTHSDEYLQMSGIQHFAFCRRQWALAYLEQQWAENLRTAEGRLEHARCHDEAFREKRGGLLTVRGMRVVSHRLRLTGACDVVEFRADPAGVPLQGQPGLWLPTPVEYKHGAPKESDADRLQPRAWRWKRCWPARCRGARSFTRRPAAGRQWS